MIRGLVSDKEGAFALMKKGIFEVEATDAIRKTLKEVWVSVPKGKYKGVAMCNEHGLTRLTKSIETYVKGTTRANDHSEIILE
ncbi:hypothetical protein MRX96_057763 [Rhipicephalus microplus]